MKEARRVASYDDVDENEYCYYKEADIWYLWIPGVGLGNLANHAVTENADGTITVTPSILVTSSTKGVPTRAHGYLADGKWREC